MRLKIVAAAVFGLGLESMAIAAEPTSLAPAGAWSAHRTADSCRVARQFGSGKTAAIVIMEQFQPSEYLYMTMTGKLFKSRRMKNVMDGAVRFGPAENETEVTVYSGSLNGSPAIIFRTAVALAPLADMEKALLEAARDRGENVRREQISSDRKARAQWLQLSGMMGRNVRFETGPMDIAFNMLDACTADLVRSWGLDPEQQMNLSRWPQLLPGSKIDLSSDHYPRDLLETGKQARLHTRLLIDAQGQVTDCRNTNLGQEEGFAQTVCREMRKLRFAPALDAAGKPVASYYFQPVSFMLAERPF